MFAAIITVYHSRSASTSGCVIATRLVLSMIIGRVLEIVLGRLGVVAPRFKAKRNVSVSDPLEFEWAQQCNCNVVGVWCLSCASFGSGLICKTGHIVMEYYKHFDIFCTDVCSGAASSSLWVWWMMLIGKGPGEKPGWLKPVLLGASYASEYASFAAI